MDWYSPGGGIVEVENRSAHSRHVFTGNRLIGGVYVGVGERNCRDPASPTCGVRSNFLSGGIEALAGPCRQRDGHRGPHAGSAMWIALSSKRVILLADRPETARWGGSHG
jgi:hypothetical protein